MRIFEITLDSTLTFEIHLREVVSKAVRSLGVVHRAGKLFAFRHVLKSCFNVYALSRLGYCGPVWMLSVEFHLGLLDSVVRSVKRLGEGERCCLGDRRKISVLWLLYKIYYLVNEYLHHFASARNTRVSAALGELA